MCREKNNKIVFRHLPASNPRSQDQNVSTLDQSAMVDHRGNEQIYWS